MVLDADFLSSFFKIGRLRLVLKALNVKCIVIPSTVYEEVKVAPFFDELALHVVFKEDEVDNDRFIFVKQVDLSEDNDYFTEEEKMNFGKGEIGCFLLAKMSGEVILIDDQIARSAAKENGLKVLSIPAFLLFCKKKKIISLLEIREIIKELKEKDYYEFSEEAREALLE